MMDAQHYRSMIAEIHNSSDAFGTIVETGCGTPVASALLDVGGASNTIYQCLVPYNQYISHVLYNNRHAPRVVSLESTMLMVKAHIAKHKEDQPGMQTFFAEEKGADSPAANRSLNLVYVANFQIGEKGTDRVSHGWVGLQYKDIIRYFHLSVRDPDLDRGEAIDLIGNCALELMHSITLKQDIDFRQLPANSALLTSHMHVDVIVDQDLNLQKDAILSLLLGKTGDVFDTIIAVAPGDETNGFKMHAVRIDEIMRKGNGLIAYKGSFNPPTCEHMRLARQTMEEHPGLELVFMLSIQTVDKNAIANLWQRVEWLHALGHTVVMNRCGYFRDAIRVMKTCAMQSHCKLVFPMGADTYDRIEPELLEKIKGQDVHIKCFPRTDVSSTRVRAILDELQKGSIDVGDAEKQLADLVPPKVVEMLLAKR
jgi:nicotinic acid mononucleotide adenylyltransferase